MWRRCDRHVGDISCCLDDMVKTRCITLIVERGITLVVQGEIMLIVEREITLVVQGEITLIVGMKISKVGYGLLLTRSTLTIGQSPKVANKYIPTAYGAAI